MEPEVPISGTSSAAWYGEREDKNMKKMCGRRYWFLLAFALFASLAAGAAGCQSTGYSGSDGHAGHSH